jgi:hypothetical protein
MRLAAAVIFAGCEQAADAMGLRAEAKGTAGVFLPRDDVTKASFDYAT